MRELALAWIELRWAPAALLGGGWAHWGESRHWTSSDSLRNRGQ